MTISRRGFLHSILRTSLQTALTVAVVSTHPRISFAQQTRVRTIAGTGIPGFDFELSNELLATETPINNPYGVVIGPDGALYFCEVDSGRIRRLNLQTGRLTTFAVAFSAPHEIRFDMGGNLFVVERDAHSVRRIDAQTGFVSTVIGNGEAGFSGDNGLAPSAQLRQPHSIAFDAFGNLLICDIGNSRLRMVNRLTGIVSTLSGNGRRDPTPDMGSLRGAPLLGPRSIDTDRVGNAYLVLREGNAVFQLSMQGDLLRRIAGTGEKGYTGDFGKARSARFNGPKGIAYSEDDNSLYIADTENHVIRRMSLDTGIIDTVLGSGERGDGPDGDPLSCKLNRPHGVCVGNSTVYVTDSESHRVRAITGLI